MPPRIAHETRVTREHTSKGTRKLGGSAVGCAWPGFQLGAQLSVSISATRLTSSNVSFSKLRQHLNTCGLRSLKIFMCLCSRRTLNVCIDVLSPRRLSSVFQSAVHAQGFLSSKEDVFFFCCAKPGQLYRSSLFITEGGRTPPAVPPSSNFQTSRRFLTILSHGLMSIWR